MILFAIIISIIINTASLTWGYLIADLQPFPRLTILLGTTWLISIWQKWRWFPTFGLFISLFLAVTGLWFDLPLVWMFSGAIFALIAWDLNQFQIKLSLLPDREDKKGMTRRRLIRISILALAGLTIALVIEYLFSY